MDEKKEKFPELNAPQYNWDTSEVTFKTDPLIDLEKKGRGLILRFFNFKFNPAIKKRPTKQELFNSSWKQCRDILWKDGLKQREDISPKVSVGKNGYTIYITAEPRLGVNFYEKPKTLEEVLKVNT